MLTALNAAVSALNAQSVGVDTVGNNLANLSTTGFKASSVQFSDLFYDNIGSGSQTQLGLGVNTPITRRNFTQGSVQSTGGALDVAVQGSGFLVTKTATGATQYTRAGNLSLDKTGRLQTAFGDLVQGLNGNITVPPGTIKPATATSNFSAGINLDARDAAVTLPETASNVTSTAQIPVYGSEGVPHLVTVSFWKTAAGQYDWKASVPASDLGAGGTVTGSGTLQFNASGKLISPPPTSLPTIGVTNLASGESNLSLTWNLYDTQGNPTVTNLALADGTSSVTQNGNPGATLSKVTIGNGGVVLANYSDGTTSQIDQLQMANFTNPETLQAVGNNSYRTTLDTSAPAIGAANTGGRGQILGGSLESSTVDIATEFTNLMVYQRGYQANAKVVTAADQINQTTIELKQP